MFPCLEKRHLRLLDRTLCLRQSRQILEFSCEWSCEPTYICLRITVMSSPIPPRPVEKSSKISMSLLRQTVQISTYIGWCRSLKLFPCLEKRHLRLLDHTLCLRQSRQILNFSCEWSCEPTYICLRITVMSSPIPLRPVEKSSKISMSLLRQTVQISTYIGWCRSLKLFPCLEKRHLRLLDLTLCLRQSRQILDFSCEWSCEPTYICLWITVMSSPIPPRPVEKSSKFSMSLLRQTVQISTCVNVKNVLQVW